MKVYSLFELNTYLRRVIALNFQEPIWIQAELAQVSHKKHFFLELVQKSEGNERIIAQSPAFLWQRQARSIQKSLPARLSLTELLQPGMEVKVQVRLQFEERYGMQLLIEDLDPTPTLGKLAVQRAETLNKLGAEGLLEANKKLTIPRVLQRIAILSSPEAAGKHDFLAQLANNPYGYQFYTQLFPILVQGDQVAFSLEKQFKQLQWDADRFDAIVLIRGGGSKLDLAAFDDYQVCKQLAQLPLPLITGIGHEIDESIADLLAAKSLKTPTAAAEYLIHHNAIFEGEAEQLASLIEQLALQQKNVMESYLLGLEQQIDLRAQTILQQKQFELDRYQENIQVYTRQFLQQQNWKLQALEAQIQQLDPTQLFKRGFSLSTKAGKTIQSTKDLKPGDLIETHFKDGKVISAIKNIDQNE